MALSYLSSTERRVSGVIKNTPQDFAVEEICPDGTVLEANTAITREPTGSQFVHFVVQKENWSTPDAVREIASRIHVSPKRINYAGTKDKRAITTQLMSAFGVRKEALLGLTMREIKILGAWNANEKVDLGMLLGNRFKIRVEGDIDAKIVNEIHAELRGKFPNYFGPQRFGGSRANTHIIGEKLLQSDLRGAVEYFLMDYSSEINPYAIEARKKLVEERDYRKAVDYFPKHLKFERLVLLGLAQNPNDHANALRKLPRQIMLLFVHAFQSHLFNISLSERLAKGPLEKEEGEYFCEQKNGFPNLEEKAETGWLAGRIIGYETELNEREAEILERFNLRKQDFKMKTMPEINSKGTFRTLLCPMRDFVYKDKTFAFSLPSGAYATSALREFIKDLW